MQLECKDALNYIRWRHRTIIADIIFSYQYSVRWRKKFEAPKFIN